MATSRLLGRTTASTGAAEEISVAGGLTLSAGVLTGAAGTVTSVTGTSPVVSSGGATPAISMPAATTSVNGYLTSTDWTTFNNKGSGTVTSVTGTSPVVSSGGATPAISMPAATTSVNGYLTSTDWTTFNGKQAALVSGTNIKTVGGVTLLGAGDVGTIGVAYGGTGVATLTSGYLIKGNGTSAVSASVVYDTGTNVGIGTASPGSKLDVRSANISDGTNGGNVTIYSSSAQAADSGGKLDLGGLYDATNSLSFASVAGRKENSTSGNWSGYLQFSTREFGGSFAERMRITSVGNVGIGATPNASALLDVQSTTKGLRLPNMTTVQKNAISSPAAGLMVFDTTLAKACVYSGAAWQTITSI
jgi:hypothetical protein